MNKFSYLTLIFIVIIFIYPILWKNGLDKLVPEKKVEVDAKVYEYKTVNSANVEVGINIDATVNVFTPYPYLLGSKLRLTYIPKQVNGRNLSLLHKLVFYISLILMIACIFLSFKKKKVKLEPIISPY